MALFLNPSSHFSSDQNEARTFRQNAKQKGNVSNLASCTLSIHILHLSHISLSSYIELGLCLQKILFKAWSIP